MSPQAAFQLFEGGALAGSPYRIVSGAVLAKWAALKYEAGPAGLPAAAAASFSTSSGFTGQSQQFAGGVIYGNLKRQSRRPGLFHRRSHPVALPGAQWPRRSARPSRHGLLHHRRRPNARISKTAISIFTSGAPAALEHLVPPLPCPSPPTPPPLSPALASTSPLAASPTAPTLRVSVAGQPDFIVKTPNGAYDYDLYIDSAARSSTVAVHAVDLTTGKTADGAYTVRTIADARPELAKVAGDNQTGTPGALLPVRLAVALKDSAGVPTRRRFRSLRSLPRRSGFPRHCSHRGPTASPPSSCASPLRPAWQPLLPVR